jgi:hypothetical protein
MAAVVDPSAQNKLARKQDKEVADDARETKKKKAQKKKKTKKKDQAKRGLHEQAQLIKRRWSKACLGDNRRAARDAGLPCASPLASGPPSAMPAAAALSVVASGPLGASPMPGAATLADAMPSETPPRSGPSGVVPVGAGRPSAAPALLGTVPPTAALSGAAVLAALMPGADRPDTRPAASGPSGAAPPALVAPMSLAASLPAACAPPAAKRKTAYQEFVSVRLSDKSWRPDVTDRKIRMSVAAAEWRACAPTVQMVPGEPGRYGCSKCRNSPSGCIACNPNKTARVRSG